MECVSGRRRERARGGRGRLALGHLLPLDRAGPVAEAGVNAVVIAAIPEEAIKFFVLVYLAEKHVDVRRLQDLLVLALAVSLGFATLENFGYVISAGGWKTIAALRAIAAVPGHGIDGLAMGALLIRARLSGRAEDVRLALIVPIILHAAYDFPLMAAHKEIGKIVRCCVAGDHRGFLHLRHHFVQPDALQRGRI